MKSKISYGQYCPLSMAAEFLCQRWTMLILREVFFGSHSFNEISRGVPRMSRTLLSNRLKELTYIGVLSRNEKRAAGQVNYKLTNAGKALGPLIFGMAEWGQKWLQAEPAIREIDIDLLMWDIRRNAIPLPSLPNPFVAKFLLTDAPEKNAHYWLVLEDREAFICHQDRNLHVDVDIEVDVRTLCKIWMGWEDFNSAITDGLMVIHGPQKYTKNAQDWLGRSTVAHIEKVAPALQLNYEGVTR